LVCYIQKYVIILGDIPVDVPPTKILGDVSPASPAGLMPVGLAFSGTGLCSCRVRDVDGSCAKHLTVESYMVIYAANSYTYYY